MGVTKKSET